MSLSYYSFVILHEKNDFAQVSKNLARYRSENNLNKNIKYKKNKTNKIIT